MTARSLWAEYRFQFTESALAVKLVDRFVQAVQRNKTEAEDASVDGKDHQKNIHAVAHGRSLLITGRAAGGRMRSRPPSTRGPGSQPPSRMQEHPLLP